MPNTAVVTINCSAKTDANQCLSKLLQFCQIAATAAGQVLRPRNTEKALVYFKNFDLPKADKWGTVQLNSFLQQLLTHGGFYNEELQWIGIERIQFVFSMSCAERRPISTRFTSIVRIASVHETQPAQLQNIYAHYLGCILKDVPGCGEGKVQGISSAICRVFTKFTTSFSVDEWPHYDFTYRDITKWVVRLQRYINNSNRFTMNVVVNEGMVHFVDRLTSLQDKGRLTKDIQNIFRDGLGYEETEVLYTNYQVESNDKPPLLMVETSKTVAQNAFRKLIQNYQREMGELSIFQTADTEALCSTIMALIALPSSNIVAVTSPGMAFIEILKIVCHSHGMEIHSPPPLIDFNYGVFAAFLKELIQKVASKDDRRHHQSPSRSQNPKHLKNPIPMTIRTKRVQPLKKKRKAKTPKNPSRLRNRRKSRYPRNSKKCRDIWMRTRFWDSAGSAFHYAFPDC
jgi:dynein heavy chain 2